MGSKRRGVPIRRELARLLRHTVATRLLTLGMDITDLQRKFDALTDPGGHELVVGIRRQRGDDAALLAAELLAQRRAERISNVDSDTN
jgi:integrase/recombinase XerD